MITLFTTVALVILATVSALAVAFRAHGRMPRLRMVNGVDATGRVWECRALEAGSVRLYVDGRVYLDAGGEVTFRHVTRVHTIRWYL